MRSPVWLFFLILATLAAQPSAAPAPTPEKPRPQPVSLREMSRSFEQLTARVRPAVVQVFTTSYAPIADESEAAGTTTSLFGKQRGSGSGVLLTADGYIVTNNHVVENGRKVQVRIAPDSEELAGRRSVLKPMGRTHTATVVGVDRESDLAVLKIDATGLPYLRLGDSDTLRQGQIVMAFGNPLGLESSVSMGVVSAVARQLRAEDPMVYVQTDAPINPGNSGGPLIDSLGRVVGINTFIFSQSGGSEGIGFAVPSNIVKAVFEQIRTDGHVRRGRIGIFAQTITPQLAGALQLPDEGNVIVADVEPDGPAELSGVKIGDVVLTMNGKPVENARQLEVGIYRQLVKEKVTLDVLRDGKRTSLTIPVIEREDDPMRFRGLVDPVKNQVPKLGILTVEINAEIAKMLPDLRFEHGLVVAAGSSESAANGLKPGDVIYTLNKTPVVSVTALVAALDHLKAGDPAVLQIQRGGRLMYLSIDLE